MSLYIGTNYHPHDWSKERWDEDIRLMKEAGLTTVRMGHLAWDSYEPQDGVYTFEWFDDVMNRFAQAGIKVVLDISLRPAPRWVHRLCPGCNIGSKSGSVQESLHRYMEDVADLEYQFYAFRFAKKMVERYREHPALFSFGLCNEVGSGMISYSEYARKRFVQWLEKKYETVDALNKAWNTQRWCRIITSFEEVSLPENELTKGSPESYLDMRRFFSDGLIDFMKKFYALVKELAPEIPCTTNLYADNQRLGYDYLKENEMFMEYPGMGYYPFYDVYDWRQQYFLFVMKHDLGELNKPLWFLEFQTGTEGIAHGPKDYTYMQMMLALLNRGQMALAWTWRTMYGGKEQFYHGVLGHDGYPTQNYEDLKHLARDYRKLENYAFPYVPRPEIGVAMSQESWWMTSYHPEQFRQSYIDNIIEVQKVFFENQLEYNFVNLRNVKNAYKLLIVPGHILMDDAATNTIREFVKNGGTVIMTAYSGMVDETGTAYQIPHPGNLSDVFGIRVASFYRTNMPCFYSEDAQIISNQGKEREWMRVVAEDIEIMLDIDYYEQLELMCAQSVATFADKEMCAISVNHYGKGTAYYVAAESNASLLKWLIELVTNELQIGPQLTLPKGVQGRKIAENQYFYVNMNRYKVEFALPVGGMGVLTEKEYQDHICLEGYQCELIISNS